MWSCASVLFNPFVAVSPERLTKRFIYESNEQIPPPLSGDGGDKNTHLNIHNMLKCKMSCILTAAAKHNLIIMSFLTVSTRFREAEMQTSSLPWPILSVYGPDNMETTRLMSS